MKKNSGGKIQSIEIDPISGDYYVAIPEWMMNDLSWYEDTKIKLTLDGKEIVLTECEED